MSDYIVVVSDYIQDIANKILYQVIILYVINMYKMLN